MLTDIKTIKSVLSLGKPYIPVVMNERIALNLTQYSQLQNAPLVENMEFVKRITRYTPVVDPKCPITLNDEVAVDLSYQKIVWNTVTVSSDAILTTIYTENIDYIIDYVNGTIKRTSASAISSGSTIYIWYQEYEVLVKDQNYDIDYINGQIRRKGSVIPNDATVYVDYVYSPLTLDDSFINEIIKESENYLSSKLKSTYTLTSSDEGLKSAATNFTLYLLCLAQAAQELSTGRDNSDAISKQWIALSVKYLELSRNMFMPFANSTALLDIPAGGLIQNQYSASRTKSMISPTVSVSTRRY